jgi:hypothetical protein
LNGEPEEAGAALTSPALNSATLQPVAAPVTAPAAAPGDVRAIPIREQKLPPRTTASFSDSTDSTSPNSTPNSEESAEPVLAEPITEK